MAKFAYTSKNQVKIHKPKSPKFAYTSKSQIKVTKPRKESLSEIARLIVFESSIDKLTVVNPQTKNRIKVKSALEYPHDHPAYLAALALLKKKKVMMKPDIKKVKPGETIPLFDPRPYEDPRHANIARVGSALAGEGAKEHLEEFQRTYLSKMKSEVAGAVKDYTATGYRYMNASLRGDMDEAYNAAAEAVDSNEREELDEYIDTAINQMTRAFYGKGAVLQNDVLVYRGISGESGILEEIKGGGIGTVLEDSGFISTSVSEKVATSFAGEEGGVLLKIVARKGTRAIYPNAGSLTDVDDEDELILNRGMSMKVIDIKQESIKSKYAKGGKAVRHIITVETVLEEEELK